MAISVKSSHTFHSQSQSQDLQQLFGEITNMMQLFSKLLTEWQCDISLFMPPGQWTVMNPLVDTKIFLLLLLLLLQLLLMYFSFAVSSSLWEPPKSMLEPKYWNERNMDVCKHLGGLMILGVPDASVPNKRGPSSILQECYTSGHSGHLWSPWPLNMFGHQQESLAPGRPGHLRSPWPLDSLAASWVPGQCLASLLAPVHFLATEGGCHTYLKTSHWQPLTLAMASHNYSFHRNTPPPLHM